MFAVAVVAVAADAAVVNDVAADDSAVVDASVADDDAVSSSFSGSPLLRASAGLRFQVCFVFCGGSCGRCETTCATCFAHAFVLHL